MKTPLTPEATTTAVQIFQTAVEVTFKRKASSLTVNKLCLAFG